MMYKLRKLAQTKDSVPRLIIYLKKKKKREKEKKLRLKNELHQRNESHIPTEC